MTITGITTFMLLPFLALALTAKGLSVTEAGAAIATVMLFQQGGGPIAGFVVHRLGGMWPMLAGIALRLAALVLLSTGSAFAPLITACAALGFGGALISLPIRFAFIRLPDDIRRKTLALRGTAVNFGAIVGPAVGGALISVNFATVCFLGICSHLLVLTLVVVARLGLSHTPLKQDEGESAARMSALKRTSRIAPLLFAAFAFWFGYAQLNVSVPLAARSGGASDTDIAALFVVNAVIVLSLEYPLVRSVGLKFSSRVLVLVGLGVLAIGFVVLTVGEIAIIWRGWLFIVLFSLAEILYSSSADDFLARRVGEIDARTVGFVSLCDGAGSVLGAVAMAALLDRVDAEQSAMVFFPVAGVIAVAAVGLALLARRPLRTRQLGVRS